MGRSRAIISLILTMAFAISAMQNGCNRRASYAAKFGTAFNATRQSVGLPLLQSNWILQEHYDYVCWSNPAFNRGPNEKTIHWLKKLHFDAAGCPVYEVDEYETGKVFRSGGPDSDHDFETLYITYDFHKARDGNPWRCTVNIGPDKGEYDLESARKILKRWGIDWAT